MGVQVSHWPLRTNIMVFKRGKLIASCWISDGTLYGVHVIPEYRGKGYGHLLMRYVTRCGIRPIRLHVAPFDYSKLSKINTACFYHKWGFRISEKSFRYMEMELR